MQVLQQALRVARPTDDWIYSSFFFNSSNCFNLLYAFNHLRRPLCPTHHVDLDCCPITTTNQQHKYGKKGAMVFWKCPRCHYSVAITNGSYFHALKKLSVFKVIKLLYKFYQDRTAEQASKDDDLNYDLCRRWFDWFRRCISHYMQHYFYPSFSFNLLHPTEWDESSFAAKQKHHRGARREPVWVIGGVQRITNLVMLQVVDRRDDVTLVPIIHLHSMAGATIITDAWGAYNPLRRFGYSHWSLNHSRTFADPLTGWHSNTIEGVFGLCKLDLKKHKGIPESHLQRHLDVWCFKRDTIKLGHNYWERLLLVIGAMQDFVPGP